MKRASRQGTWAGNRAKALTIAVNVSAIEFRQRIFWTTYSRFWTRQDWIPGLLELELTETVLMKRAESAASVLQALRVRGIRISVDDFGTGYSSLSYLRKFPIDALKIDQSFVQQITVTRGDTTIVAAIISMGRSMNLRVIAEGVETAAELAFLRSCHCDEGQGYLFSRPLRAQQFATLLSAGIWIPGYPLRNGSKRKMRSAKPNSALSV